jgi:hypothetical protein
MHLVVTRDELDQLAGEMARLADAGRGWINLVPEGVERAELAAVRSVPGMIFGRVGGRGAPAPKITWTAPEVKRRRTEPAHLGIEHPAGAKARQQLREAGHPVPAGWSVVQDHSLRGLVVVPVLDADPVTVIRWAIDAATILARDDPGASWQAQVFEGR